MEALLEVSTITVNKQATEEDHVLEFVELLERGWKYPPIVVRKQGSTYVLVDGRHRLAAHKVLGLKFIRARITI